MCVKHAPHIDMIDTLNIEHEVGKAGHRPKTKAGQIQFMRVTRRACRGVMPYVNKGPLKRVDKSRSGQISAFSQIMINNFADIAMSQLPGNNLPWLHKYLSLFIYCAHSMAQRIKISDAGGHTRLRGCPRKQ